MLKISMLSMKTTLLLIMLLTKGFLIKVWPLCNSFAISSRTSQFCKHETFEGPKGSKVEDARNYGNIIEVFFSTSVILSGILSFTYS